MSPRGVTPNNGVVVGALRVLILGEETEGSLSWWNLLWLALGDLPSHENRNATISVRDHSGTVLSQAKVSPRDARRVRTYFVRSMRRLGIEESGTVPDDLQARLNYAAGYRHDARRSCSYGVHRASAAATAPCGLPASVLHPARSRAG
jgi:hypothetical protein